MKVAPSFPSKQLTCAREVGSVCTQQSYQILKLLNFANLAFFSSAAMESILDMDAVEMPKDEDFVEWVAGNRVIKGSIPLSHRYGGYQFGYWASQLGDGR